MMPPKTKHDYLLERPRVKVRKTVAGAAFVRHAACLPHVTRYPMNKVHTDSVVSAGWSERIVWT